MEPDEAAPDGTRANSARMYDWFLGGAHNFAVDREQATAVLARHPSFAQVCRANRAYVARVVRWCLERGVDQFLDLGSGVPTVGNVHEIAHALAPGARVAYVDVEPVAVAHAEDILATVDRATITQADLRDVAAVLAAPGVAGLLDLTRPVALLATFVLHFVDGDLAALLGAYRAALAPGSVLAISHGSDDQDDPALAAAMRAVAESYRGTDEGAGRMRTRADILGVAAGTDVVAPGLVDLTNWPAARPDEPDTGAYALVAVVR